jgi:hypothetical protein
MLDTLRGRRPSVTIIDGVNEGMGSSDLNSNDSGDFYKWWHIVGDPLLRLTDGPVIVIDHVVKNREARGQYASGTGQKGAKTHVHYGIEVLEPFGVGMRGKARIRLFKDKPGQLKPHGGKWKTGEGQPFGLLLMESDPLTKEIRFAVVPEAEGVSGRLTGYMEKVSLFIHRAAEPVSKNLIESAGLGKAEYLRRALGSLVDEGYVASVPKGGRTVFVGQRLYREIDDPKLDAQRATGSGPLRRAGE